MKSNRELAFRAFVLVAFALPFLTTACTENQQLSKKDVKIAAGEIRTLALASGQVSVHFAKGNLTEIFFRNQSELFLEKVHTTADQLENSADEEIAEKARLELNEIVGSLHSTLEKTQTGQSVTTTELNELGYKAAAVEDRLKEK